MEITGALVIIKRCCFEERVPGIIGCEASAAVALGHVLAHGVATETIHAALALLEVDRVGWQVPVHHCVTPPVEGGSDE